jgi:pimeloyl-ACP methyl ester carboxylesterase
MTMISVNRVTLSYREESIGGEVRAYPRITANDETVLASARHLVLLIHGYNNDLADAEQAYKGFHARQRDLDADSRYGNGRTFVEVYWPGDAAWGIVSFLFYMGSITHAIETAEKLAAYLTEHINSATRIDIVAHSMGCRLGLEVLRALMVKPAGPQIGRIVFMAGAVPTFMLEQHEPPRRLRPAYDNRLSEGTRSLFSGADFVLAFAFPAGQSLALESEGFLPTAIGHAFWADVTAPSNLGQRENPQAGHSDYWGWNTKPGPLQRAMKTAREVANYLQFPSAGIRSVDTRFPVESTTIEARTIETRREIGRRNVAVYS